MHDSRIIRYHIIHLLYIPLPTDEILLRKAFGRGTGYGGESVKIVEQKFNVALRTLL